MFVSKTLCLLVYDKFVFHVMQFYSDEYANWQSGVNVRSMQLEREWVRPSMYMQSTQFGAAKYT